MQVADNIEFNGYYDSKLFKKTKLQICFTLSERVEQFFKLFEKNKLQICFTLPERVEQFCKLSEKTNCKFVLHCLNA